MHASLFGVLTTYLPIGLVHRGRRGTSTTDRPAHGPVFRPANCRWHGRGHGSNPLSSTEVRRAESGTPRSLQQIWPPPAFHARILQSPLDRHELVDEDGSGGGCAGIVEEADRSKYRLR
jgi:hypothetical protein